MADNTKAKITEKNGVELEFAEEYELIASNFPFDPTGTSMVSTDVEAAIKENYQLAKDASIAFILADYNGNANNGRYLELFNGISTFNAPLRVINPVDIITIVARTTSTQSNAQLEFVDLFTNTVLYTLSYGNNKEIVLTNGPLFTIPANGELAIRVSSGSVQKPHLYFIARGS